MKLLYTARCERFDLLYPVCVLAREVTRWTRACDKQLHRLMCYFLHSLDWNLETFIGDPIDKFSVVLYCDADFVGDTKDSKSTSGAVVALVGPNSYVPVSAWCKTLAVVPHLLQRPNLCLLTLHCIKRGFPF